MIACGLIDGAGALIKVCNGQRAIARLEHGGAAGAAGLCVVAASRGAAAIEDILAGTAERVSLGGGAKGIGPGAVDEIVGEGVRESFYGRLVAVGVLLKIGY